MHEIYCGVLLTSCYSNVPSAADLLLLLVPARNWTANTLLLACLGKLADAVGQGIWVP